MAPPQAGHTALRLRDERKPTSRNSERGSLPILDPQARHASEPGRVVRYQRQLAGPGLTGDQDAVRSDRRALRREVRTDLASMPRVILIELHHGELKCIHARHVLVDVPTLESAIVELVEDDRGQANVTRCMPASPTRDRRGHIVEESDDRVGVEQMSHTGRPC